MTIPNLREIRLYIHCNKCVRDGMPEAPSVGFTDIGLQIWCDYHNANILHIDFENQKHAANDTCIEPTKLRLVRAKDS